MHNITDKGLLCAAFAAVATAWLTHHSLGAAAAFADVWERIKLAAQPNPLAN